MTKKVGLLLLSLFVIFWFGVSFANPIAPINIPDVCYKLKNVEIDNYRVVIEYGIRDNVNPLMREIDGRNREVYEPKANACTKCGNSSWGGHTVSKIYLLDKLVDIKEITQENIDTLAIYVGDIHDSDCTSHYDIINTYKITNNGSSYEIISSDTKDLEKIRKFSLYRFFAVLIETLVLFFIAKIFWGKDETKEEIGRDNNDISNKKLLLWGVIPTTITLPLLWFVLPLIMGDGNLYIVVGEILVATIESVMIKNGLNISRKKAIITSIICNLLSFLIVLLFDLSQNFASLPNKITIEYLILFIGFIFVEGIILFCVGKSPKDGVSNKKLILCGLFTIIADVLLMLFMIQSDGILYILGLKLFIIFIISKLLVNVFVIKLWGKISRKKSIIISILFNLCIIVTIFSIIYFLQ